MSDQIQADEILNRLRAANPVSVSELEAGVTAEQRNAARQRAIELAEAGTRPTTSGQASGRRPRKEAEWTRAASRSGVHLTPTRVVAALLGLAVATALILLGVGTIGGGSSGGGGSPAFAEAAIRVAQANPRLLVTEPGWSVTRADEFTPDEGEMTFSDGTHELDLNWYPARYYKSYYRDRSEVDKTPTTVTVLGQAARMVQYGDRSDYATMLPPQGETFVEIRGDLGSESAYLKVLRSLEPTDVDTWLSAMPPSVVRPTDRAAAVDEMLRGIPLPPGFDLQKLRSENAVLDRYQLGARVSGAVACTWIDRWLAAAAKGDAARADEAAQAMATSRTWPILREMADQGGWSPVVWEYARQMAQGNVDYVRQTYAQGLGCNDH